jgi:hypothetical protein
LYFVLKGEIMRLTYLRTLLAAVFVTLLVGCTTMGKPYTPPPPPAKDQGLVYMMRTSVGYGNFWSTTFYIDDQEVVSLHDKGYTWVHLHAGVHEMAARQAMGKKLHFKIPIKAGQTYFIEFAQESAGYNTYRNVLRGLLPERGLETVKTCTYVEASKDLKLPKSLPAGPVDKSMTREKFVQQVADEAVDRLCGDSAMLDAVHIPKDNCKQIVTPYIPACNKDSQGIIDKTLRKHPELGDYYNINPKYLAINYRYCLVQHHRGKN